MNNDLLALNNLLFEQLEKLSDEDCDLSKEVVRSKAITDVASQIISNGHLALKACELTAEYKGIDERYAPNVPAFLEGKKNEPHD